MEPHILVRTGAEKGIPINHSRLFEAHASLVASWNDSAMYRTFLVVTPAILIRPFRSIYMWCFFVIVSTCACTIFCRKSVDPSIVKEPRLDPFLCTVATLWPPYQMDRSLAHTHTHTHTHTAYAQPIMAVPNWPPQNCPVLVLDQ